MAEKINAIVLLSGGMDSCVTAAEAIRRHGANRVGLLHASYGQRTEAREARAFREIAEFYSITRKLAVRLDYFRAIGGSALTDPSIARLWRLGVVWIVVPLVFFSFAKTKLPNYIALEFPALALVTALYFDSIVRKGVSRSAIVSAATVPVFIGALAFAIAAFSRDNRITADASTSWPA